MLKSEIDSASFGLVNSASLSESYLRMIGACVPIQLWVAIVLKNYESFKPARVISAASSLVIRFHALEE
jgi:hypothetical protein